MFYNRNQQLKEQNKTLQDTNNLLEERYRSLAKPTWTTVENASKNSCSFCVHRLRAQKCERCAALEEDLKNKQDQNLSLITKLSEFTQRSQYSTVVEKLKTAKQHKEQKILRSLNVCPGVLPRYLSCLEDESLMILIIFGIFLMSFAPKFKFSYVYFVIFL